jgi:ribosomal protein L37E
VTAVLTTPQLTAAERCDRCGAQAYVRVLLASGGELLFCAHHGREHAAKLREVAAEIQDETERLTTPAGATAQER